MEKKIVFCGDSITDSGRDRSDPASLGNGYVAILHEKLKNLYEDIAFTFVNAGVSGDRVADVEKRVDADVVAQAPMTYWPAAPMLNRPTL